MKSDVVIAITPDGVVRFDIFDDSLSSPLLTDEDIIYNGFEHFYVACPPRKLHVLCDRLQITKPETIDNGTRESTKEVWDLLEAVAKPANEVLAANRGNRPSARGGDERPDNAAQKGRNVKYSDDMVITVKAADNPKKGTAKARFALYKTGMTVKEYLDAGGKRPDISWDSKQGWIEVGKSAEAGKSAD